jgi:NADPH:quinone reductase-like Zn-dependent oxidoreductase
MRAIVIKQYGGPEVLAVEHRPEPIPNADQVLIQVQAFGINHAESYFRSGAWGDVAEITGIECVGLVKADPSGRLAIGQKVLAIVGGLGRNLNGSYAEYTAALASNVAAVNTDLSWQDLAAIPESYATAWTCLFVNLELAARQTLLIRGTTSAVGQAAVNLAAHAGAQVIATTRNPHRTQALEALGAQRVLIEGAGLRAQVHNLFPRGIDAVIDLIGNTTILDSLNMLRRGGRACLAGFLGGGGPIANLQPVFQIPSGRHLSVFASALVTGTAEFPLAEIPFQDIVDRVADGTYKAKPARIFDFNDIREAHRLMESNGANGKIVIRVAYRRQGAPQQNIERP